MVLNVSIKWNDTVLKCKKNTKNIDPQVSSTSNNRTMILSKCAICKRKKSLFIMFANLECLIETFKLSFKCIENMHDIYKRKDCTKKFYESLRERAMEIINLRKKKMTFLTKEQEESY